MVGIEPRRLKSLIRPLTDVPILAKVICPAIGVGLSLLDRSRVRFDRRGDEFRYGLADGAVLYSTEFDLMTKGRLRVEADTYYLVQQTLRPGDVVIDAGASIGTFAFVAAGLVGPTGKVIAVEAHPASFERLRRGVSESAFTNIHCVHAALVATDGEVLIDDSPDDYRLNAIRASGGSRVPGRRLTSLVEELGINRIDLLKMNIEGAETAALAGSGDLADRGQLAAIAVSCHDFMAPMTGVDSYRTRTNVARWLDEHGYETRWGSDITDVAPLCDYAWAARR